MNNNVKAALIAIVLVVGIVIAMPIMSYVRMNDAASVKEVAIRTSLNKIKIEEEEITEIQEEMKEMIQEYTDYEHSSNELVVENLNPTVVGDMYPELKSSRMYNKLNSQYLKSMRNIKDAKSLYNKQVEEYNQQLVTLRGRLFLGGRAQKELIK